MRIDASGSELDIENCYLDNIGDKGLSAGEKSIVNLRNSLIANAEIHVASKDGSKVYAENLELLGGVYGLTAYNKKDEFEFGTIIVNVPPGFKASAASNMTFLGSVMCSNTPNKLTASNDAFSNPASRILLW